jgi:hypothetical protein
MLNDTVLPWTGAGGGFAEKGDIATRWPEPTRMSASTKTGQSILDDDAHF